MFLSALFSASQPAGNAVESGVMQNPASLLLVMMVVVFLVLSLLIFLVWAVGKLFVAHANRKSQPKDKGPKGPTAAPRNTADVKASLGAASGSSLAKAVRSAPDAPAVEQGITDETVAAIVGAVTAFESALGTRGVIRSIRKADGSVPPRVRTRSAWSQAGIAGNTTPFGV